MRISAPVFNTIKYGLYALLTLNVLMFLAYATVHEALDSLGWLMLLAALEWQSASSGRLPRPRMRGLLQVLQVVGAALVLYAWGLFFWHRQWLDAANATAWLLLVASLEADLRLPSAHAWHRARLHVGVKACLYSALLAFAVLWGIAEDALNFYDAMLWIVCYGAVEMNLLRRL